MVTDGNGNHNTNEEMIIEHVQAGAYHSVLSSKRGDVVVFGNNQFNQCVLNVKQRLFKPHQLSRAQIGVADHSHIVGIIAGKNATLVLSD